MNRRHFIKLAIGSSALATLPAVIAEPALSADPIRVGVLLPRSGPGGLFGPSCENATNLAVAEINESGGILGRMVEPVRQTRVLTKKHLVRNDYLPKIEVNPQTFAVMVDGVHATVKPPRDIALNQLYFFS